MEAEIWLWLAICVPFCSFPCPLCCCLGFEQDDKSASEQIHAASWIQSGEWRNEGWTSICVFSQVIFDSLVRLSLYQRNKVKKWQKTAKFTKSQRRLLSMEITGLSAESLLRPSIDLLQSQRKKRIETWIVRRRTMLSCFVKARDSTEQRRVSVDRRNGGDLPEWSLVSLCNMRRAMCSCRDLAWRTEREREMLRMSSEGKRSHSVSNGNPDGPLDGRVNSPLGIRIEQLGRMMNPERESRRMIATLESFQSTDLNGQDGLNTVFWLVVDRLQFDSEVLIIDKNYAVSHPFDVRWRNRADLTVELNGTMREVHTFIQGHAWCI